MIEMTHDQACALFLGGFFAALLFVACATGFWLWLVQFLEMRRQDKVLLELLKKNRSGQ